MENPSPGQGWIDEKLQAGWRPKQLAFLSGFAVTSLVFLIGGVVVLVVFSVLSFISFVGWPALICIGVFLAAFALMSLAMYSVIREREDGGQ